jgi:hypothetical protein
MTSSATTSSGKGKKENASQPKKPSSTIRSKVGRRGKASIDSDEEDEDVEASEEDQEDEEESDVNEEDADHGTEDEGSDDDDLFDSDEEAEISKRPTKLAEDEEEEDEDQLEDYENQGKKSSKVLGKRKKTTKTAKKSSKNRRSSRLSKYRGEDESEEEEEGEAEEEREEGDRLDYGSGGSDDDGRHDYNLKSIKDSHRRNLRTDGEGIASSSRSSASKNQEFASFEAFKRYVEEQLPKDLPIKPDDNDPATIDDFKSAKIYLRRDTLIKKLPEPYFEDYVKGCYVRYLIGMVDDVQVYRLCQIVGVDRSKKSYRLPPLSKDGSVIETNVRLHLNNAGEIKELQKLDKISNHSLDDKEIEFHLNGMKNHLLSSSAGKDERIGSDVTKRDLRLIEYRNDYYDKNYKYSHDEISKMVHNQLGMNKLLTTEYVTAAQLLKKRLDEAVARNDKEKIDLFRKEMKKLDDITEKQREAFELNAKKQTDINRRMRDSNVIRDMDAGMRKRHEEQEAIAKGILPNAISDPFIRRETRPKILWNTSSALQKKREEAKEKEEKDKKSATTSSDKANSTSKITVNKQQTKKGRLQEDDKWAISTQLSLSEVTDLLPMLFIYYVFSRFAEELNKDWESILMMLFSFLRKKSISCCDVLLIDFLL